MFAVGDFVQTNKGQQGYIFEVAFTPSGRPLYGIVFPGVKQVDFFKGNKLTAINGPELCECM